MFPLAQAADVGVPAKQAQTVPHRIERSTPAYQTTKTKPGDKVSINPQPLPPYPSATMTAQGARAAWPAPPRGNVSAPSMSSTGQCRPPASQSGKKENAAPDSISAYCTSRTQGIDSALNSNMKTNSQGHAGKTQSSVGTTPNWSALSGQPDPNAELSMIQLQQNMSQRQQAVAETTALQNATKPNCPKCPAN